MKSINQKITDIKSLHIDRLLKNHGATLINETSVYKEYAVLKVGSLTSNGYFDLIQIPKLRVYAGDLLKSIRRELNLTQKELSRKYGLSKTSLIHWEHDRCAISLSTLIRVAKRVGFSKDEIYLNIEEGRILTKRKVNLLFNYLDFVKILPFMSIRSKNVLIIKQNAKKHIQSISKLLNVKIHQSTNKQFVIKNADIYNLLITFFDTKSIPKIKLPQTDFVKKIGDIDLRKAIICPLLQTDGSGSLDRRKGLYLISFKNISKELHNILVDSIYVDYNGFLPSSYLLNDKIKEGCTECYVTRYVGRDFQEIYKELIKLCGNFKTSRYHLQRIEDYNREKKPHLNYLINAKRIEKVTALRIWATTEGAIIPMRRRINGLIVPKLQISCANKRLLFQLERVATNLGLHFTIRNEKKSGYKCLYNMAVSCALSFLKLGGFIDGIKISKSSKYYEGINKQDLIYAILEYMVRERKDSSLRRLSMKKIHRRIREIAKNKKYKNLNYYTDFFSQNDKVKQCLNY